MFKYYNFHKNNMYEVNVERRNSQGDFCFFHVDLSFMCLREEAKINGVKLSPCVISRGPRSLTFFIESGEPYDDLRFWCEKIGETRIGPISLGEKLGVLNAAGLDRDYHSLRRI